MNFKRELKQAVFVVFLLSSWIIPQAARGQTLFWDLPGGVNASPSGPWDTTTANWSANSNGGSQTTWLNGSDAFFSASELAAAGNYTITLATNVSVGNLTYAGGGVGNTLLIAVGAGDTITMVNPVMNVTVDGGTVLVVAPVIAGAGNLNLTGGTLVLTAANTYNGGTTITSGSLQIGNGGTTGSILGDVADNADLAFNRSDSITFAGIVSGTGVLNQIGSGTLTLTANNLYSGGTLISGNGTVKIAVDANLGMSTGILGAVTLQFGELLTTGTAFSTARAINLSLIPGDDTLAAATGTTATYTGVVSGTGGLTVGDGSNTGTIVLTGTNTYSGGNTLLRPSTTLQIGNGGATGSIIGNVADSGIVAFDRSDSFTFSGAVSGTGSLSQIGSGTLILTGPNTYSGGTLVSGGKLSVDTDGELGSTLGGITLQGGELVTTTDGFTTARTVDVSPTGTPDTLAAATGTAATYTGLISDTGGLTVGDVANSGTVVFTAINSYAGGTTVSGGILSVVTDANLGDTTGSLELDGGELLTTGSFTSARTVTLTPGGSPNILAALASTIGTYTGTIAGSGGLTVGETIHTGTVVLSGANTYTGGTTVSAGAILSVANNGNLGDSSGGLTLNGGELLATGNLFNTARAIDVVNTGILAAESSGFANISGNITVSGGLTIGDAVNNGVVAFSGINTYTGNTTIVAGATLRADTATGFSPNSAFTVNGTLDLRGSLSQVGSLSGTGLVTNQTGTGAVLTAGSDNSSTTFSGAIQNGGFALGLTKTGSGTLILSGTNSYTGATSVSVGTLEVDGALGNTAVSVENGAILAGHGTIVGDVTIQNGGHLAPGPVAQTLGVGNLSLSSGSILDYVLSTPGVIGGGVNTLVNVGGNLTLAGILNVTNGGSFGAGAYRLINYTGVLGGTTLTLGTLPAGFTEVVTTAVPGQVNLVVSASGGPTQFWNGGTTVADGTVHGGDGTWDNFTTNFTNPAGTSSQSWQNGFAVFSATPGTVTLGDNILFQGMEFAVSGCTVVGAGSFTLTATGGTVITSDSGVSATISASIGGVSGLTKAGLGVLTLSGSNTYTGGTKITMGVLSVASNTNLGNASGGLTLDGGELLAIGTGFTTMRPVGLLPNGGTLAAAAGGLADFEGNITGRGPLSIGDPVDTGTVQFSGTNTYTGATTVQNGVTLLALSQGALSPGSAFVINGTLDLDGFSSEIGSLAGTGTVTSGAPIALAVLTVGAGNSDSSFSGVLQDGNGTVGLTKVGSGTLTLTGTNTYTGGTTISGGTLQIGNGGTIGSITGNVIDNSHFAFNRSDTLLTFPGNISGTGTLSQLGLGTLALSGINTYSGVTTVSFGTLQAGSNTAFSPNSAFTVNSFLNLAGFSNTVGSLAGSGTVTNNESPETTIVLPAISSGTPAILTAGGNGTNTIFSGTLINGTASLGLTKAGLGTLTLSGANTYTGGTTITGGTLQIGNGGATGSIVGNVTDNSKLAFDRSDAITFPAIVSGTGALTQIGSGMLTLPGANTYSGGTMVQSGTLVVDNAAALGTGDVSVNGGTLATEVRPINVLGNYTQNAGGTLQLRVAGANVGQYDSLNVHGNASVGGTLQLISLGFAPVAGNQLSLVSTGGTVSGRFAHFVDPFVVGPAFNTIDLVYGFNSVVLKFLNVTTPISPVVSTIDFQSFAAKGTSNQRASAGLLDQVELDPGAASVIGFLFKEPETNFLADFAKISPDVLSSLYEISFSNSNIQRLNLEDRLDAVRNGSNGFSSNMNLSAAKVYLEQDGNVDDGKADKSPVQPVMQPSPENRWGVWVSGFGDFVNVDGDGNGKGYDFTTGGVTVGIDFRLTDNLVVGLMGDYSHTWSDLKPGHLDVDSGRGGLYASWFDRGFYLDGAIYAGHNNYDTARSGLDGLASGGTEGSEWSAFFSGGYDFQVGHLTIGPIGALQYTEVNIDGFSEKGSVAPMAIHDGSAESLRSDIGFRTFYQWQVGKVIIEPSLKATWEHEYKYSALPITAGFAGVPGPSGTFFGPSEGHDSAVVDAGVSVQWTPTLSTYLNYDGQLGRGNYDSNAVTGGVRVSF